MLKEYDLKPLGRDVKSDQAVIDLGAGVVSSASEGHGPVRRRDRGRGRKLKVRQIPRVHAKADQLFSQLYQETGNREEARADALTEKNEKLIADNLAKARGEEA